MLVNGNGEALETGKDWGPGVAAAALKPESLLARARANLFIVSCLGASKLA